MGRASTRAVSALALAVLAVALLAAPAQAAAYRYWTYWQAPAGTTAWGFATQGPATGVPADGSVEGWAFGITTQSGSLEDAPATAPDFARICAGTPPSADRTRVAVVIDTGPAGITPDGQVPPAPIEACVVVAPGASGYDVLRAAADVRTEDGLVCGIAGYPSGECAPVLSDAEAQALLAAAAPAPSGSPASAAPTGMDTTAAPAPPDTGSPVVTIVVVGLVLVGAAIGVARYRRSS